MSRMSTRTLGVVFGAVALGALLMLSPAGAASPTRTAYPIPGTVVSRAAPTNGYPVPVSTWPTATRTPVWTPVPTPTGTRTPYGWHFDERRGGYYYVAAPR